MQFQRYFVEKINSIRPFINKILKFNSTFLNYDFWHEILVTDHLIHVFNFLPSLATKYLLEGYGENSKGTTTKKEKGRKRRRRLLKQKKKQKKSKEKQKQTNKKIKIEAEVH